ncbi:unnamed protein product, partial [Brugia timori]|uniref:Protein RFT1 homolog n=1 Tax=Brugia timori TaxID=42155 RepID=A0A0R3QIA7_9BILA
KKHHRETGWRSVPIVVAIGFTKSGLLFSVVFVSDRYGCRTFLQEKLDIDESSAASASKETGTGSSDTASTSYQQYPEMSAEQEFFLYELETTDSGSVGLVLRLATNLFIQFILLSI